MAEKGGSKGVCGLQQGPFRASCKFQGRTGSIVLDQIRTIDRDRLLRRLGKVSSSRIGRVLTILEEMFEP